MEKLFDRQRFKTKPQKVTSSFVVSKGPDKLETRGQSNLQLDLSQTLNLQKSINSLKFEGKFSSKDGLSDLTRKVSCAFSTPDLLKTRPEMTFAANYNRKKFFKTNLGELKVAGSYKLP